VHGAVENTASDDRRQDWREVAEFARIAFGVTGLLHGGLALTRRPFSTESRDTPAIVYGIGLFGPTLAAIMVEHRHHGRSGVRELLRSGHPRTMSWGPAAAALVAQPLMQLSAARMSRRQVRVRHVVPLLALGQLWVVAGEEYGWRGFVWPRLSRRIGPVKATLVIAAMWGLWHFPMFFVPQSLQAEDRVFRFGSAILAWSFLHSLLQLERASVATAMVLHAATNLSSQALDIDLEHSSRALTGVYAAVAATAAASMGLRGPRSRSSSRLGR